MTDEIRIFNKGIVFTLVIATAMGVCNYITRRLLSFRLTPDEFGLLYSSVNLFLLVSALVDLGINNTVTLRLSVFLAQQKPEQGWRLFFRLLCFKAVIAILIALFFLAGSEWLCRFYYHYPAGTTAFRFIALYIVGFQLLSFLVAAFNGMKLFLWMNFFNFSFYAMTLLWLLPTAGCDFTVIAGLFSGSGLVGIGLVCILFFFFFPRYPHKQKFTGDTDSFRTIFKIGKWFAIGNIAQMAMNSLDILLLAYNQDIRQAGIYNIAMSISLMIAPISIVATMAMPMIASLHSQNNQAAIRQILEQAYRLFSILFWSAAIFFICFCREMILLLFSGQYLDAAIPLCILGPTAVLGAFILFLYGTLNGLKKVEIANLLFGAGIPIDIVINLLLVPYWGLPGAAAGTYAGFLCCAIMMRRALHLNVLALHFPYWYNISGFIFVVFCILFYDKNFWLRLTIGGGLLTIQSILLLTHIKPLIFSLFPQKVQQTNTVKS